MNVKERRINAIYIQKRQARL